MRNAKENVIGISRIARFCAMAVLSLAIIFTFSFGALQKVEYAYAADYSKWEDCDWDGYDDHTGVAVPWPGFDGTRGDTPAGPSPNSQTGKKKAAEEKKKAEEAEKAKKAAEAKKKKAAEKKKAAAEKKKAEAAKKKAAEKKAAEEKAAEEKAKKDKDADKDKKTSEAAVKETTGAAAKEAPPVKTTEAAVEVTEAEVADIEPETVDEELPEIGDLTALEAERDAAIVDTIGVIEVSGAEGTSYHEGSEIVIRGSGFYGDVAGIDIEIHSDPQSLGTASSDADGNFELKVTLPKGIAEGSHSIVALYKGTELVNVPLEVKPAPADSFLKAFSVGLTGGNPELAPGVLIFIVLVAIGLITLFIGDARRRRKVAGVQGSAKNKGAPAAPATPVAAPVAPATPQYAPPFARPPATSSVTPKAAVATAPAIGK